MCLKSVYNRSSPTLYIIRIHCLSDFFLLTILNIYYFKVIKVYGKYLKGTYRAKVFESWRIDLVEKRLILSTLVGLLPEVHSKHYHSQKMAHSA
jgi:hypothetical protein